MGFFIGEEQNLVAYQEGQEVYFLAIRQINANEELKVWYCHAMHNRMELSQQTQNTTRYIAVPQYKDVSFLNFLMTELRTSSSFFSFTFFRTTKKK